MTEIDSAGGGIDAQKYIANTLKQLEGSIPAGKAEKKGQTITLFLKSPKTGHGEQGHEYTKLTIDPNQSEDQKAQLLLLIPKNAIIVGQQIGEGTENIKLVSGLKAEMAIKDGKTPVSVSKLSFKDLNAAAEDELHHLHLGEHHVELSEEDLLKHLNAHFGIGTPAEETDTHPHTHTTTAPLKKTKPVGPHLLPPGLAALKTHLIGVRNISFGIPGATKKFREKMKAMNEAAIKKFHTIIDNLEKKKAIKHDVIKEDLNIHNEIQEE